MIAILSCPFIFSNLDKTVYYLKRWDNFKCRNPWLYAQAEIYLCMKTDPGQASFPGKCTAIDYILFGKNLNVWMHVDHFEAFMITIFMKSLRHLAHLALVNNELVERNRRRTCCTLNPTHPRRCSNMTFLWRMVAARDSTALGWSPSLPCRHRRR